jgi:hypothetical protein
MNNSDLQLQCPGVPAPVLDYVSGQKEPRNAPVASKVILACGCVGVVGTVIFILGIFFQSAFYGSGVSAIYFFVTIFLIGVISTISGVIVMITFAAMGRALTQRCVIMNGVSVGLLILLILLLVMG